MSLIFINLLTVVKKIKTAFSIFNVLLFVSYLLVAALNNFSFNQLNISSNHAEQSVNTNEADDETTCSAIIFQKNEKDNEYFSKQATPVLQFFVEFLNFQTPLFLNGSDRTLAENSATPIYISVCNLRI